MNKPSLKFNELIELVDSSVMSGSITEEYNDYLTYFRELGISSYVLNLLIQKYKKKYSSEKQEIIYDGDFFITSPTFLPEKVIKEKEELETLNSTLKKRIAGLNDKNVKLEKALDNIEQQKNNHTTIVVLSVLVTCGVLFLLYFLAGSGTSKSEMERLQKEIVQKRDSIIALTSFNSSISSQSEGYRKELNEIKSIGDTYPLVITDLEVGNIDFNGNILTDFGKSIYSSNTMFLAPRIKYYGFSSRTIKLYVKLYRSGILQFNPSKSPSGYTYSSDLKVSHGNDTSGLLGWGGKTKGQWSSGQYRFEIWYSGKILFSKSFTIY